MYFIRPFISGLNFQESKTWNVFSIFVAVFMKRSVDLVGYDADLIRKYVQSDVGGSIPPLSNFFFHFCHLILIQNGDLLFAFLELTYTRDATPE